MLEVFVTFCGERRAPTSPHQSPENHLHHRQNETPSGHPKASDEARTPSFCACDEHAFNTGVAAPGGMCVSHVYRAAYEEIISFESSRRMSAVSKPAAKLVYAGSNPLHSGAHHHILCHHLDVVQKYTTNNNSTICSYGFHLTFETNR